MKRGIKNLLVFVVFGLLFGMFLITGVRAEYSLNYLKGYSPVTILIQDDQVINTGANCVYSTTQGNWVPSPTNTEILKLNVICDYSGGDEAVNFLIKYKVLGNTKVDVKTKTWGDVAFGSWCHDGSGWLITMDKINTIQRISDTSFEIDGVTLDINIGETYTIQENGWFECDHGWGKSYIKLINIDSISFEIEQYSGEYDEECNSAHTRIESYIECVSQTCAELGKECGTWDDGCGGIVDCGACSRDDDIIMKLFSSTNSHGALWNFSSESGTFFGNQNIGSGFSSMSGRITGGVYTVPQDGTIENITVYFSGWTSGEKAKCGIYDQNRNFIASTEERSDGGDGWQTFDFASPVSVGAGVDYSLVCWGDSTMGVAKESGAPATNYWEAVAYGAWPVSLDVAGSTYEKSIYASYGGGGVSYDYEIYYSDIFGATYTGANPHTCSGTNKVLGLFNISNSHAEIPSLDNYGVDVCYGDLVCEADSSAGESCTNGGEVVVRLFQDTNSHISNASDTNYPVKICCKQGGVIPTGNVYWTDMQGNPITSAEIGDAVLMIYQDMAGQNYDFEIFENDRLFDDYIRSVTESFDFGIDLAAKWVITQEDWEKDIISDPEFIFVVDSITSENLIVPEDSFDNSPPLTQIIKPIAETNYIIRQGQGTTNTISFEQISSDADDDLKIKWEFGGGESASFDNCLSGTNCDTTHQYTVSGTKNIILTASEMAPRTPTQFVKDNSRIYVYGEGITAFVVMDYVVNGRMVTIDATQTHVSDCYYAQTNCEGSPGNYGSGNCYQVTDEINPTDFVWCHDLTLRVDGIDSDPNLFLDWTADGIAFTPNRVGSGMKYIKIFDQPGDHIINLRVRYKL